jgi:hypothetical protein
MRDYMYVKMKDQVLIVIGMTNKIVEMFSETQLLSQPQWLRSRRPENPPVRNGSLYGMSLLAIASTPLPWITERKDPRHLRNVVKKIVTAAGIRTELSFTSFRHGGFTEGADSDLTDAELRAARDERTKAAGLSE